jgi:hypothetical protein
MGTGAPGKLKKRRREAGGSHSHISLTEIIMEVLRSSACCALLLKNRDNHGVACHLAHIL